MRPPWQRFGVPDWGTRVLSLLAPPPAMVPLRDSMLIIAIDPETTWRALRVYLEAVLVAVALVVLAAWLVARWITKQAIAPLLEVTSRLRHFAGGDFSPQTLAISDRSEIGDMIQAYNGAAAQVADAFAEREAVEQHMRRFVADAGHELRTPLSVITAAHEVLRSGNIDDPFMRERVFGNLEKETNRMKALVERLVALARLERPEHPEPEALDIVSLIHEVTNALRAARGGNVRVEAPESAWVYVDQADACDALGNLIDNALKYGGEAPVTVGVESGNEGIIVTVSDLGPGIPPGDRPHLFERFYRGWIGRTYGGSGLGLAIAKRAVERAGGVLEMRCGEPGRTCFALTLPRSDPNGVRASHA
jgi:two-component system OmpR family sensor kinase